MSGWVVVVAGVALLGVGVVSRRPWARWWANGGTTSERVATLMTPCFGLSLLLGGVATSLGERSALYGPLSVAFGLVFVTMLWVAFGLPVPDRVLVRPSFIRQDRVRRRAKRQGRQGRQG